jgi:hypothetical protein
VVAITLALVAGVAAVVTISRPASAEETKTVSYRGYEVKVPASWPVVDLAADPTACVRLDRPAVYLGRSTAQADCPAHGRSEGILLEPLKTAEPSTPGLLRRAVRDAGVLATAYYAPGDEQAATEVLDTGKVVTRSKSAQVVEPAAVTPSVVATGNFVGKAFDACEAPPQSTMDAWLPTSGYKAVGIYISGGLRACGQTNLTAEWVATNASKGWQFLLIDVGLQAPCAPYRSLMSTDPATALGQGKAAAANAVAAAQALGFAQRSAIYSDIEAYPSTAACKASVLSYLSGWTQELNARGYVGGAYVGAASGGVDLNSAYASTAYTRPDNLWFARWNDLATVSDDRYISAGNWTNHQRVHQYAGNVTETHGGVSLKIDRNYADLTPPPPPVSAFTVTGSAGSATLRWTKPADTTLGQIIIRGASGNTAPALPTSGAAIYNGTASMYTVTGLPNSASYAYRAFVKDSTGKIGPGVSTRLIGTKSTITASSASIMYTQASTLSTTLTRINDGGKLAGASVVLYSKAKTASKWSVAGSFTSDANGVVTTAQKPSVSTYYMWAYNGSTGLLGTRSAALLVQVKPAMSAYLAPTLTLGQSAYLYGYLNPPHAGMPVYLQRRSGTGWVAMATGTLATNGKFGFVFKPAARGTYTYRVVWFADADHQGTQTPSKVLTVS